MHALFARFSQRMNNFGKKKWTEEHFTKKEWDNSTEIEKEKTSKWKKCWGKLFAHIHKSDHKVMNAKWFSLQCKPTHINYCAKSWPFKRLTEMINGSCKLFRVVTRCENILRALPHRRNEISLACVCFMLPFVCSSRCCCCSLFTRSRECPQMLEIFCCCWCCLSCRFGCLLNYA